MVKATTIFLIPWQILPKASFCCLLFFEPGGRPLTFLAVGEAEADSSTAGEKVCGCCCWSGIARLMGCCGGEAMYTADMLPSGAYFLGRPLLRFESFECATWLISTKPPGIDWQGCDEEPTCMYPSVEYGMRI